MEGALRNDFVQFAKATAALFYAHTPMTLAESVEWLQPHKERYLAETGLHERDFNKQTFLYLNSKVAKANKPELFKKRKKPP